MRLDDGQPNDAPHSAADAPVAARPTWIRYYVVLVTFLTSLLLYLDRFSVNYAQQLVIEDLRISEQEFAWCMSAFFVSYALAQVPSGWLTDRFGSRLMLTFYIVVWSFFTAVMAWVTGLTMLILVRLATGLGQAGAYPTAASVVGRWVPLTRRGLASSFIGMGGRVGAFLAPVLTAYLIILFVPPGSPVTVSEADLYDLHGLGSALVSSTEPVDTTDGPPTEESTARRQLRERIWIELPSSTRAGLSQLAAADDKRDATAAPPEVPASDPIRQDLVHAFNGAIHDPDWIADVNVRVLPLEKEAIRKLRSESPLTEAERNRVQRLVLEAVFPVGLRNLYVGGWRQAMVVFGLCGIFVAAAYYWIVRNRPQQHPRVNAAELQLIQAGRPPSTTQTSAALGAPPMRAIVSSPSLWLLSIAQFGTNIGWVFLVTWLPRYLWEVHQASFETRGWMASLTMSVSWVGMIFGGWWTDRLAQRYGRRIGRAVPLSFSRFLAMAAFLVALFEPSAWAATAIFAVVGFATDLGSPAVWAYDQDVGGRYVASVLGWGNMWGNLGAAVSPILLESIVRNSGGSWNAAFVACAVAFFISGVCAAFVNADKPIDTGVS